MMLSLLSLDRLRKLGEDTTVILPSSYMNNPPYPIHLDNSRTPFKLGHNKIDGVPDVIRYGQSNIGVMVFSVPELLENIDFFQKMLDEKGTYPINKSEELALDNFTQKEADKRKLRTLPISCPLELTPAKSIDVIPDFIRSMRFILGNDRRFLNSI